MSLLTFMIEFRPWAVFVTLIFEHGSPRQVIGIVLEFHLLLLLGLSLLSDTITHDVHFDLTFRTVRSMVLTDEMRTFLIRTCC